MMFPQTLIIMIKSEFVKYHTGHFFFVTPDYRETHRLMCNTK